MKHLLAFVVAAAGAMLGGCFKADVQTPDVSGFYRPAPTANIAPADPASPADLRRENAQLRERIDWCQDQMRKSDKKYRELADDLARTNDETARLAAERDRYRRAAANP
jgi:hypothetical protein